ncbi:Cytochrome c oxidase copper chaperone [Moelleriella libera RCEF 2490]|uniref:Cytochrome c oxidase copper chaperone n=1 Tax=Moelleriella libera RCEF 2490 TaxID=1081109 RepID=A0A162K4T0_9HYPO|nr:Cytochrome c oxidase copper chaperone [Moelleriella libera RCEF 2490]
MAVTDPPTLRNRTCKEEKRANRPGGASKPPSFDCVLRYTASGASSMDANTLSLPSSPAKAAAPSASEVTSKPKPCCVCKDEKSLRDECMLFSKASDPAADCKSFVQQYKTCMAGFGYKV